MNKLFFLTLMVFVFYQNCSNVKVEPVNQTVLASSSKPEGHSCAPDGVSFSAPMRFVFIIDMSMSNVGSLLALTNDNETTYSINKSDGPSDINGERFNQVKKFITDCGGSADSKYAVIGFSETAMLENNQSCVNSFEDKENALKSINGLKGLQEHDLSIPYSKKQNPYYLQGQTYYSVGLNCAKKKILNDLTQLSDEKPVYKIFFITDGLTTDSTANSDYKSILDEITIQSSLKAGGISFFPVFYTSSGAKNQGAQMSTATSLLNTMAQYVDKRQNSILLSEISSTANNLCEYIKPSIKVEYEISKMFAVNVTSVMIKNRLYPDSDGDGISDDEELKRGWNPLSYRSLKVHDSLCDRFSKSLEACESVAKSYQCSDEMINIFGFSQCDLLFSKTIFGEQIKSTDSDGDLVPDWIELIRQLNPIRSDSLDIPFSDGISNLNKIILGLDTLNNNYLYPVSDDELLKFDFKESMTVCPSGKRRYDFSIKNVPLVATKEFKDSNSGELNLSHDENENVVIVFSYWKPSGGLDLPTKIYGQKVKIGKTFSKMSDMIYIGEY